MGSIGPDCVDPNGARLGITMADSFVKLRDGRRLAYSELGDPGGRPIFHQHGMPGSRVEHEAEPEVYRTLGVRVITPDRPGYGLSDPDPRSPLLDWPSDIEALADELEISRFGIIGLSGGGIYALACAAAIPHRLTRVVVTGCPSPMQRPGAMASARFMTRAGVWLGAHAPRLLEAGATIVSSMVRRFPGFFVDHFNDDVPPADRRWLSMPSVNREAAETLREAFRPGVWGYVQDIRVLARPWGFALEDIQVPVQLWHGDEGGHPAPPRPRPGFCHPRSHPSDLPGRGTHVDVEPLPRDPHRSGRDAVAA
jgi:pimeloyl-ACP methyl ester carboxylesterase